MRTTYNFRNLIYLAITSLLIYMAFSIYRAEVENSKNPMKILDVAPNDYNDAFNKPALKKIGFKIGAKYKLRNPMLFASYDNKYSLEMTKINIKPSFRLAGDIVEKNGKAEGTFTSSQIPWKEPTCTTNYKPVSTETASKIYLSLYGDSVKIILKNDSIACYYLKLKNASVQYQINGPYEIYVRSNTKLYFFQTEPSVSLMFLKKNNSLYFLLLTANDDKQKLDPNLLCRLVGA